MQNLFLDIETSGINPERHSIISIGMVVSLRGLDDYQSFYREIKHDEITIMPSSIEINHFDFTRNIDRVNLKQAQKEGVEFINRYYHAKDEIMPIGMNIGSFDMKFIQKQMPELAKRLGRRSVDLNSLIYLLSQKHSREFAQTKKSLSEEAEKRTRNLGLGIEKHNALFDAVFNLNLYIMIKESMFL